jgi:hypothetical protein
MSDELNIMLKTLLDEVSFLREQQANNESLSRIAQSLASNCVSRVAE